LTISSSLTTTDFFGDIQLTGGTITLNVPYWVRIEPSGGADPQIHPR
jgi:hypothetical protein